MDKQIIIFFGPQGSGKGTQAESLANKLNLSHISTGEIFRQAKADKTDLGDQLAAMMDKGEYVPDELTFEILKGRLEKEDCNNGYILDGYPRTLPQAEFLDNFTQVTKVIEIHISDEEAIKRLTNRRQCPACGAIYNLYTMPKPKEDELCDKCRVKLIQREDDKEAAIRKRLSAHHQQAQAILDYYGEKVIKINGEQSIEAVSSDIMKNFKIT